MAGILLICPKHVQDAAHELAIETRSVEDGTGSRLQWRDAYSKFLTEAKKAGGIE